MAKTLTPEHAADVADLYGPAGRSAWLDVDWREHQHWIRIDGSAVNYVELGPMEPSGASPLVFVHGLGGSWQNWLENIPFFARDRRVVALDLPGFGSSEMPHEPISIKRYGQFLDRFLDTLGIDVAAIVGNSMGGYIAAEVALTFGTRVERLVLVSAAGISTQREYHEREMRLVLPTLRRADAAMKYLTGWVTARSETVTRRPVLRRTLLALVAAHPELLPAPLSAEQVRGAGKPGFLEALEACTVYPIEDRLEQITAPTLILWGAQDRIVPVRDAWRFEELIAHSRKLIYDDTGHVPMLERPARFNRDVDAFLREPAAAPPQ
jgi:pimeloyl-ACP methyl ester carboxylesterase